MLDCTLSEFNDWVEEANRIASDEQKEQQKALSSQSVSMPRASSRGSSRVRRVAGR